MNFYPSPKFYFQTPLSDFLFETPERNLKIKWFLLTGNPIVLLWFPSPEPERPWVYHRASVNPARGFLVDAIRTQGSSLARLPSPRIMSTGTFQV